MRQQTMLGKGQFINKAPRDLLKHGKYPLPISNTYSNASSLLNLDSTLSLLPQKMPFASSDWELRAPATLKR